MSALAPQPMTTLLWSVFFLFFIFGVYNARQIFLNWMPSTEPQDDGVAEDIQESTEAALTSTSQGI
jgi:hypothetical protein